MSKEKLKDILSKQNFNTEIVYGMAALIDEIFIQMDWPLKNEWKNSLMEMHFSSSQVAGELIYKRIDHLLKTYT